MRSCIAWIRVYVAGTHSACQYNGDQAGCHLGRDQLLATLLGALARLITRPLVGCRGRLFVRPPKTLQMAFFCMQDQPCSELILSGKTSIACDGAHMPRTMCSANSWRLMRQAVRIACRRGKHLRLGRSCFNSPMAELDCQMSQ